MCKYKYKQVCAKSRLQHLVVSSPTARCLSYSAPMCPTMSHSAPPRNARLLPLQHFPCHYSQSQDFALIIDCHHLCHELCLSSMEILGISTIHKRGNGITPIQLHNHLFKTYFLVYIVVFRCSSSPCLFLLFSFPRPSVTTIASRMGPVRRAFVHINFYSVHL